MVYNISVLNEEEWNCFSSIWSPCTSKRKEILTSAGEKEHSLYFVTEGVQRVYYLDEDGREATLVFTYTPSFGGVLDALMLQTPSKYYYETLTRSSFLKANIQALQSAMDQYRNIDTMIRKGITSTLSGVLDRMVELQCFTVEQRFKALMERSPHILNLIPHKYIANYLGMDATNFSKLLNHVRL